MNENFMLCRIKIQNFWCLVLDKDVWVFCRYYLKSQAVFFFLQPAVNWVVSGTDREKYDDLFRQMDTDNDGLVTGSEVIEVFMQSTLSQTMLAQIWWDHSSDKRKFTYIFLKLLLVQHSLESSGKLHQFYDIYMTKMPSNVAS